MNIEEKIAIYPELSSKERDEVRAYVKAHPEWESALSDAARWDELLITARSLGEDESGADAIAHYVVTRDLRLDEAPPDVVNSIRSIRERVESDPEMQDEARRMSAKYAEIEAAVPARAHFERLTGHDFDLYTGADDAAGGAAAYQSGVGRRIGYASPLVWRVAASFVALLATYGLLFVVGETLRPQHERLASFEKDEVEVEGYGVVRSDEELRPSNDLYLGALEQLRLAETSFIGLFPSYDQTRLDSAAGMLSQVIAYEPDGSFLEGEASYLLGKTELARGRLDAADEAFARVIAAGSRWAGEASRIQIEMEE